MQHIVFFSGGITSWAAAKRVAARYGTAEMKLVFTDTNWEDDDTYRWLKDAAANVGAELVWLSDGRTIWDVFRKEHIIGNHRMDSCSQQLKRIPARTWIEANCNPATTILYMGYDWNERHRIKRTQAAYAGWHVESPMAESPYLTKPQMLAWAEKEGIRPQQIYQRGLPHANCFAGETRFLTYDGSRRLGDLAGKPTVVLTRHGWKPARVEAFGIQHLRRLTITRPGNDRTIYVTGNHRWLVRQRVDAHGTAMPSPYVEYTTDTLKAGIRLPVITQRYGQDIARRVNRDSDWRVISVEPSDREEEVFCAVVPGEEMFTLAGDILTGNCRGGCVKAGAAHWLQLLRVWPERYAEWEQHEEQLRAELRKDVSMLGPVSKYSTKQMTLRRLRALYGDPDDPLISTFLSAEDANSGTGCGCFVPDDADDLLAP